MQRGHRDGTQISQGLPVNGADSPRVFVPPPLIFGGFLGLGLFVDRDPAQLGMAQVSAILLASISMGLIVTALGLFRTNRTRPEPWQPSDVLVNDGVYRFTRNPMYLGMALLSLAIALFFMSLPAVGLTLVAAIIIDRTVIVREEAYLARRFGGQYQAYRRSVRRWL